MRPIAKPKRRRLKLSMSSFAPLGALPKPAASPSIPKNSPPSMAVSNLSSSAFVVLESAGVPVEGDR